jgi:hypothetical protein
MSIISVEVLYANGNIWLSQKRIADLFGCSADNISLHLKNISQENMHSYDERRLQTSSQGLYVF